MDALQNNDGKTHLIKRTSTEAKLMGFASVFMVRPAWAIAWW